VFKCIGLRSVPHRYCVSLLLVAMRSKDFVSYIGHTHVLLPRAGLDTENEPVPQHLLLS
jgi:hypothetical protein